jgi:dienelactone hydrolase
LQEGVLTCVARIADQFAANGYFVVMPDLYEGDAVSLDRPEDFDIMAWDKKVVRKAKVMDLDKLIPSLTQSSKRCVPTSAWRESVA